jgi:Glycosyl transferase 4-like domain
VGAPPAAEGRPRILLTAFGWEDAGGGTIVPRQLALELARRGWDVTVFHAAVPRIEGAPAYTIREWQDRGVRLIGVFNRPHGLLDLGHPEREVDDPPITRAFAAALDRLRPDVVHFHKVKCDPPQSHSWSHTRRATRNWPRNFCTILVGWPAP